MPRTGERPVGLQMHLNGAVQRRVLVAAPAIDSAQTARRHDRLHLPVL